MDNENPVPNPALLPDPMPGDEKPKAAPSGEKQSPVKIWRAFGTGLLVVALMLALEAGLEQTFIGKQIQQMVYIDLLSSLHPNEDMPVSVVDISAVPLKNGITPRDTLLKIVTALADKKPAAIGVDIDFSPRTTDGATPEDEAFFDQCASLEKQLGVPIFLGIYRTREEAPADWLGNEDYKDLAACLWVPADTRKMPLWIRPQSAGDSEQDPTLCRALATEYLKKIKHQELVIGPSGFWRKLIQGINEEPDEMPGSPSQSAAEAPLTAGKFLVDYSPLQRLEAPDQQFSVTSDKPDAAIQQQHDSRWSDKMVLLGDSAMEKPDFFAVPNTPLHPGVFLHACAAYTLVTAPLYEFTTFGRVGADLLFALFVLVGVTGYRLHKYRQKREVIEASRPHYFFTLLAVAVIVLIVRESRLMWDDFLFVCAALLLHSFVEESLPAAVKWQRQELHKLDAALSGGTTKGGPE